jgi:hypothetical protein
MVQSLQIRVEMAAQAGVVVRKALAGRAAQELLDKVTTVLEELAAGLERLKLRVALVGLVFSLP